MSTPRIVPASSWRRQTWKPLINIPTPAPNLWIHHGAAGSATLATLLSYEKYHVVDLGWRAIGYSFAITGDGTIYVCRGWGKEGGHTRNQNRVSHAILLVGNWSSGTVPQAMVDSAAWLIRDGHRKGQCPLRVTGGHREAPGNSTSCPGAAGMAAIPRIRAALSGSVTPTPAPAPSTNILTVGLTNDSRVRDLQRQVNRITTYARQSETLPKDVNGLFTVNGDFGPTLARYVVYWAKRAGMSFADERNPQVGPKTLATLVEVEVVMKRRAEQATPAPAPVNYDLEVAVIYTNSVDEGRAAVFAAILGVKALPHTHKENVRRAFLAGDSSAVDVSRYQEVRRLSGSNRNETAQLLANLARDYVSKGLPAHGLRSLRW